MNGNEKTAYTNLLNKYGNTNTIKKKIQFINDSKIDSYTNLLDSNEIPLTNSNYVSSNINCGIRVRDTLDIALNTDIHNIEVKINGKTENYQYNKRTWIYRGITKESYQTGLRDAYLNSKTFINNNRIRNIEGDSYNLYLRPEDITNGNLEERILWR